MKIDRVYSSWFVYYMQEFKLSSSVNHPAQLKSISLTPAVQAGIKNDEYSSQYVHSFNDTDWKLVFLVLLHGENGTTLTEM